MVAGDGITAGIIISGNQVIGPGRDITNLMYMVTGSRAPVGKHG